MSTRRRMMMAAGGKIAQIKELPLGSKLKLSSDKVFVLQAKNVRGHQSNSATFVSEYIVEDSEWVGGYDGYTDSRIHEVLMPKYYNELTVLEKSKFVPYDNYQHFWLPYTSAVTGGTFGFTSATRIKRYSNGTAGKWWTSTHYMREGAYSGEPELQPDGSTITRYEAPYYGYTDFITKGGHESEARVSSGRIWYTKTTLPNGNSYNSGRTYSIGSHSSTKCGVVPFCDINGDTYVKFKSGYWMIYK